MKAPIHLTLFAGLTLALQGQSADSLAVPAVEPNTPMPSQEAQPKAAGPESAGETTTKTNQELIKEPSRYAGIDLEAYIHTVSSTFSMRNRVRDPFGRHQDPNYKPAIPKPRITKPKPGITPAPVTPFVDIVEAIRITTIIPAQRSFLVGDRSFTVGDEMSLKTKEGKLIKIQVVSVQSDRVKFRNSATNETAVQALRIFPGGMTPSPGGGIRPPGVTAPDDPIPLIDISGSGAGTSLSSSR